MERPLTTLIFVISWFAISDLSILVDSKTQHGANSSPSPRRSPHPSPPPSLPPSPPPTPTPTPPSRSPPPSSPPPRPRRHSPPFPVPQNNRSQNKGQTVGLFFVGFAALLQICVVGFLVFKRRQLLRSKDRYDGLS